MTDIVVTVNAGSANIKLAAFSYPDLRPVRRAQVNQLEDSAAWLAALESEHVVAFGHRILFGGTRFPAPSLVDDDVVLELQQMMPLGPLHEPPALHLLAMLAEHYPATSHIACFDTCFHHTLPSLEKRLPIPAHYHAEGMMRYGAHGLSYEYIASRLPQELGAMSEGRVVVAHLGGTSSLCGMIARKSRAVSAGFTSLSGMMSGGRCGQLEPGVLLHMLQSRKIKPTDILGVLQSESGLKGLSGESADLRELLRSPSEQSTFAVAHYCYQAAKQIGEIVVALGGIDALVFTGGIGENMEAVRGVIVEQLRFLGDFQAAVIPTDEALMIARACVSLTPSFA